MPVGETIKMVGIRKNPNEPLGLTVEQDDYNQLVVARILAGGMIDKQGLLNKGDVILEVNGVGVNSPEELQTEISRAKESVTLKIGPNIDDEMKSARLTALGGSAQVKSKSQEAGKKLAVSCFLFSFAQTFPIFRFHQNLFAFDRHKISIDSKFLNLYRPFSAIISLFPFDLSFSLKPKMQLD
jgi:hypothetical protein